MAPADEEPLPFWFEEKLGATSEQLAAAESYIGFALPGALRSLLKVQNGGVSNLSAYEDGDAYYPLLPFFGVDAKAGAGTMMRADDVRDTFDVPDGVVVFAGQGNAWWGLDYRSRRDRPAIVYRNETGEPVELVADDFDELLGGLTEG